jgi:hypothetical protein
LGGIARHVSQSKHDIIPHACKAADGFLPNPASGFDLQNGAIVINGAMD